MTISHVVKDGRKGSEFQRVVFGNGHVMGTVLLGCDTNVASALTRNLVSKNAQGFYELDTRNVAR